jgi:hypothetical protein
MKRLAWLGWVFFALASGATAACSSSDDAASDVAYASIKNDFNDPQFTFNPPWTICQSAYLSAQFGKIAIGDTSGEKQISPGLDNVLMVAAWADPACAPAHCLPIASKAEEEIVSGQHRTITIAMPSHQGPCPPEGVPPIAQALYDRILALWPQYGFLPYAQRTQNPQCLPSTPTTSDAGTDAQTEASTGTETEAGADAQPEATADAVSADATAE